MPKPKRPLRDVSAEQPVLEGTRTGPGHRPFVARCREVIAGGGGPKSVYLLLASFCKLFVGDAEHGTCRVSQDTLVAASEWSRRTLQRFLSMLERGGLVTIERTGRSSRYIVRTAAGAMRHAGASEAPERRTRDARLTRQKRLTDASTEDGVEDGPEVHSSTPSSTPTAQAPSRPVAPATLEASPAAGLDAEEPTTEQSAEAARRGRALIAAARRKLDAKLGQKRVTKLQAPREPRPEPTDEDRARAAEFFRQFDAEHAPDDAAQWWERQGGKPKTPSAPPEDIPHGAKVTSGCTHPRMMGGYCEDCGYDDGSGFQPDPDSEKGNAAL